MCDFMNSLKFEGLVALSYNKVLTRSLYFSWSSIS
jgi:hypothetical protein